MDKYGMITPEEALVLSNKFCESIRQIFEDRPDDEEEVCKNCEWFHPAEEYFFCENERVPFVENGLAFTDEIEYWGCNQWGAKEECLK